MDGILIVPRGHRRRAGRRPAMVRRAATEPGGSSETFEQNGKAPKQAGRKATQAEIALAAFVGPRQPSPTTPQLCAHPGCARTPGSPRAAVLRPGPRSDRPNSEVCASCADSAMLDHTRFQRLHHGADRALPERACTETKDPLHALCLRQNVHLVMMVDTTLIAA